jgi:hypothetical protein
MRPPRDTTLPLQSVSDAPAGEKTRYKKQDKHRDRDKEENLGDADECSTESAEPKHRQHNTGDQEKKCCPEHDPSPLKNL